MRYTCYRLCLGNDVNERNYRKKTNALKQHIPAIHLGVSIFVIPHSLRWLAVVTRNPLSIIRRQSHAIFEIAYCTNIVYHT